MNVDTKRLSVGVASSFILWYFVFLSSFLGNFWYRVTLASIFLTVYGWVHIGFNGLGRISVAEVTKGIISGVFLYALFVLGFNLFRSFVQGGAEDVYLFRVGVNLVQPALLLLVTSFCEEFFWRMYVQTGLKTELGWVKGVALTAIMYGGIHVPTLNWPLVMAALIAGAFWGILFEYSGSFWLVVFSHIVWTELIFVFLPLG